MDTHNSGEPALYWSKRQWVAVESAGSSCANNLYLAPDRQFHNKLTTPHHSIFYRPDALPDTQPVMLTRPAGHKAKAEAEKSEDEAEAQKKFRGRGHNVWRRGQTR